MTDRTQWILKHYRLTDMGNGWIAESLGAAGEVVGHFMGFDKSEVIRKARAYWGHFNFTDEAVAFATIFPPQ